MTRTEAITEKVDMSMTQRKYMVMIGMALELGGRISDMTKLNMTIERRMVISKTKSMSRTMTTSVRRTTNAALIFRHCLVQEESRAASNS